MARKKATEDVAPEVVEEVKEVVQEETPKATKKSSTKKKAEKVEAAPVEEVVEAPVEEVPAEAPVVEEPVVEEPVVEAPVEEPAVEEPAAEAPVEEVKVEEAPKAVKAEPKVNAPEPAPSGTYRAVVTAKTRLNILRGPSMAAPTIGSLVPGAKVLIEETSGNFGRIGRNKWVNINFVKKI